MKGGAPKGGRVHWFWYLLSMEVKNNYTLSMDYSYHHYLLYRQKVKKNITVITVVRTSRNCFRMTYHNSNTGKTIYKSFRSAGKTAEWLNKFLPLELKKEELLYETEMQERHFVKTLKGLMKERRLTQEYLGRAIGISQQSVSKMLTRKWYPPKDVIERIAEYFGVSEDIFYS